MISIEKRRAVYEELCDEDIMISVFRDNLDSESFEEGNKEDGEPIV